MGCLYQGDSGAIHVRRGEAPEVMTCEGQNKGWNHPLQLGVDNDGRPYGASIHRTEMRFVDVQPGDVIVLGERHSIVVRCGSKLFACGCNMVHVATCSSFEQCSGYYRWCCLELLYTYNYMVLISRL